MNRSFESTTNDMHHFHKNFKIISIDEFFCRTFNVNNTTLIKNQKRAHNELNLVLQSLKNFLSNNYFYRINIYGQSFSNKFFLSAFLKEKKHYFQSNGIINIFSTIPINDFSTLLKSNTKEVLQFKNYNEGLLIAAQQMIELVKNHLNNTIKCKHVFSLLDQKKNPLTYSKKKQHFFLYFNNQSDLINLFSGLMQKTTEGIECTYYFKHFFFNQIVSKFFFGIILEDLFVLHNVITGYYPTPQKMYKYIQNIKRFMKETKLYSDIKSYSPNILLRLKIKEQILMIKKKTLEFMEKKLKSDYKNIFKNTGERINNRQILKFNQKLEEIRVNILKLKNKINVIKYNKNQSQIIIDQKTHLKVGQSY